LRKRTLVAPDQTADLDEVYAHSEPYPFVFDIHHRVPLSWGGRDVPANRIVLSPNSHRRIHYGIDLTLRYGGPDLLPPHWRLRFGKCWGIILVAFTADPSKWGPTL
jgi:hypothetical protein